MNPQCFATVEEMVRALGPVINEQFVGSTRYYLMRDGLYYEDVDVAPSPESARGEDQR